MAEAVKQLPETKEVKEKHPIAVASHPTGGLIPQSFEQLWRLSVVMAQSNMMPKGMEKPEAVFVAVQMGLEVGLSPMQAVQNIAVINGRPTIWGDSALGLVRASGELKEFKEWFTGEPMNDDWTAHCHVKREGYEERENSFSLAEARVAGLYPAQDKFSPWGKYPRRMLQMRARSWALRDEFTDVLKGLQVREEQQDITMVEVAPGSFQAEEITLATLESRLVAFDGMVEAVEDNERIDEYVDFLAKHFNTTAESIKAEAAETEKSWQDFVNTYHAWCDKHPAKEAKKIPCPWPDCRYPCTSKRGLKKHLTQQHEGKKPPESPPETEPPPETTELEKTTTTELESESGGEDTEEPEWFSAFKKRFFEVKELVEEVHRDDSDEKIAAILDNHGVEAINDLLEKSGGDRISQTIILRMRSLL